MIVAARRGLAALIINQCIVFRKCLNTLDNMGMRPIRVRTLSGLRRKTATPRGRAALDGKTVLDGTTSCRQPSAAPIYSIRNGSHAAGGTSPAWYVRRFCLSSIPSPQRRRSARFASTLRYVARCCQWVGGFVPSGVFAQNGSLLANEPACPAYRPVGQVEGSSLVAVAPPAVGSAAAGAVSSHIIRSRTGPSGELNLGFGSAYSPRSDGSRWANEPAPKPRGSARERSGRVFGVPDRRKGAIALYGALTRFGGVSGETEARYGDQCPLSPRERVRESGGGVPGFRTDRKRGWPLYGALSRPEGPSTLFGKSHARSPPGFLSLHGNEPMKRKERDDEPGNQYQRDTEGNDRAF